MISVIIPTTLKRDIEPTLESIKNQTYQDTEVIIIEDKDRKGASWARNRGVEKAKGEYLFFCDDDVILEPWALESLLKSIEEHCTYFSYGWYYLGSQAIGDEHFSVPLLKTKNYISTMSLVKKDAFPGFDETFKRFQDWDLWLTMVEQGHPGSYCGMRIFRTEKDPEGLSTEKNQPYTEAVHNIVVKHGL